MRILKLWSLINLLIVLAILLHGLLSRAAAHEHVAATSSEQNKVYDFYRQWNRPKGPFVGIGHRTQSCCNRIDCFPVVAAHLDRGTLWIRIQYPNGDISAEYRVDPAIIESNQEDPRESPDARSHACIIGGAVACFVEGAGG
jgi:hypothetical protein